MDTLKLDSPSGHHRPSEQQYDLVRGIIQLARTLQLDVVAEGIETSSTAPARRRRCAYGQATSSPPDPEPEVAGWLMRQLRGTADRPAA